ncbi:MAG: hypothetical protein JEY79_13950 [Pseudodesulfovibrio sp.]|nr:hypothetical protein [Pseudodesulfovibrio sp.]
MASLNSTINALKSLPLGQTGWKNNFDEYLESLFAFLSIAMNDDGTLKAGMPSGGWWAEDPDTPIYESDTAFSMPGDNTSVYTVGRAVRIAQGSVVYGHVVSAVYADSKTVITVTATVESDITAVAFGQPPENGFLALRPDTPDMLQTVFGDEAQVYGYIDGEQATETDLANLTVTRNHIEWTLTVDSQFSDVTLPYDGTYVFHIYPAGSTIVLATSYKTDGNLPDPDSAAGEIRIVVERYNSRKSIVSLQNMEA